MMGKMVFDYARLVACYCRVEEKLEKWILLRFFSPCFEEENGWLCIERLSGGEDLADGGGLGRR
ncbi:hypothetical protein OIU77_016084 [Salix suchowensis]|uniref:Uncharacterized protein n=1 Tax=Salix suchowensis TaxID=1278906 RepID=A0ABQ8ZJ58_9ROSI|nr:hypothetical protein OIU77_016084 [Salix suchowensis]